MDNNAFGFQQDTCDQQAHTMTNNQNSAEDKNAPSDSNINAVNDLGRATHPNETFPDQASGGFWIGFIRFFAWTLFCLIIVMGLYVGYQLSDDAQSGLPLLLVGFIIGPLIACSSIAVTMVLLDAAKNLKHLTTNSDIIVRYLQQRPPHEH